MTIVVGYVPTPEGRAALRRAAEEARLREASLVVVSSVDAGSGPDAPSQEEVDAELDLVKQELAELGLAFEVRRCDRGRLASEDILDVVEEVDAELVVIGVRRRSRVGKLVLGSHAQTVILNAPCPVVAVKPAQTASAD